MSGPARPRRSLGRPRGVALAAIIVAVVLLAAVATLYLNRRAAARELLVGWLDRRGIVADVTIERLELDSFVGRIRIGDPSNPDFSVQRAEVDYALAAPWAPGGLGVTPTRIRLLRPIVRASLKDGRLSFGSLDPLIDEFTGRPPRPDSRSPIVLIETGRLRLDTEYGPLQVLADARLDDGRLMALKARMPAASLKSGDTVARGLGATLDLTTTGDRVAVSLAASSEQFAAAGVSGRAAQLKLDGALPYPDLQHRRGDGQVHLTAGFGADSAVMGEQRLTGLDGEARFDGGVGGWIETFRIIGGTRLSLRAASLQSDGLGGSAIAVSAPNSRLDIARMPSGLTWRLDGPATLTAGRASLGELQLSRANLNAPSLALGGRDAAFEVTGPATLTAGGVQFGDLALGRTTAQLNLDLTHDGATLITATGALHGANGRWPLFGAVTADDVPEFADMKRALGDFAVDAPGIRLTAGSAGTEVTLTRPMTLSPANGGRLTIQPTATPIYTAELGQMGGGALDLTATRGRGLPQAAFAVPAWRLTPGGFTARLDGHAALDFGVARGLQATTRGDLALDQGVLSFTGDGCSPITAQRLELDENDIIDLKGSLCPDAGPLFVSREGLWTAHGALKDVSAEAPFLAVAFDQAEGAMTATGGPSGLRLDLSADQARVRDTTAPRRFNPVAASGSVALRGERWAGAFDIHQGEARLGRLTIQHDGATETGGAEIEAPALTFVEGGLQPSDLTPLLDGIVKSPVTGSVAFSGRFDWHAEDEGTSSGRVSTSGLNFVSPLGPVTGLKGTIDLTSLAPLITAPDQSLTIDSIATVAPLTDVEVGFALDEDALSLGALDLKAAGGTVRIEPLSIPLTPNAPITGVVMLDHVQLGDLVEGAGFTGKVQLDAVVSGRLPFTRDAAGKISVTGGSLQAVQPGRLSIQREALSGLEAGGGGGEVPPNTVEDLAYQAMQNLAFDILTADVNSLDQGRLSVLFHIKGRHDPPERQELRLTLPELISREFLNRPLPLPSDTGIDLTLDTTLNLDQLVSDLMAISRLRSGEAADPSSPAP